MNWVILLLAGIVEVGWAVGLKFSVGFTKPVPSVLTLLTMILSLVLLAIATKTLPLGTAYAVWVGIGVIGTAIAGVFLFSEPVTLMRMLSLLFILVGIIGLKLTQG